MLQAIQLTWETVKQLLTEGEELVNDTALTLIPDSGVITTVITACQQLPLCSFATPKTWSGTHLQVATYPNVL